MEAAIQCPGNRTEHSQERWVKSHPHPPCNDWQPLHHSEDRSNMPADEQARRNKRESTGPACNPERSMSDILLRGN
jgi:hypothetical protein